MTAFRPRIYPSKDKAKCDACGATYVKAKEEKHLAGVDHQVKVIVFGYQRTLGWVPLMRNYKALLTRAGIPFCFDYGRVEHWIDRKRKPMHYDVPGLSIYSFELVRTVATAVDWSIKSRERLLREMVTYGLERLASEWEDAQTVAVAEWRLGDDSGPWFFNNLLFVTSHMAGTTAENMPEEAPSPRSPA